MCQMWQKHLLISVVSLNTNEKYKWTCTQCDKSNQPSVNMAAMQSFLAKSQRIYGTGRTWCWGKKHQSINGSSSFILADLWFSVRLRWRLMSSKASLRKVSLLTSCCWHWSNTCSMLSMYCGVHLFSSSRDFSYFSLAWDRKQKSSYSLCRK